MAEEGMGACDPVRVFEKGKIFSKWDEEYYHRAARALYDRAIGDVLRLLGAREGDTVLDAGCGPGVHSIRMAKRGCRVRAVDVSAVVLEEAKRRSRDAGVADRIAFEKQDLTALPFPDGAFDKVLCWGVVVHIPRVERALGELARVVGPGGKIALETTNLCAWDHGVEGAARALLGKRKRSVFEKYGRGRWFDAGEGEKLWLWYLDTGAVARFFTDRGFRLAEKRPVEFTNLHFSLPGAIKAPFYYLNTFWYRMNLPAGPAVSNLMVLEKRTGA